MKWTGCFCGNSTLFVYVCLLLANYSIFIDGVATGKAVNKYEDTVVSSDSDSEGSHHSRGEVTSHGFFPGYVHSGYDSPHYDNKNLDYYHHGYHEPHFASDHGYHSVPQGYDPHGSTVKSLLLPLAGIALLGAAAALVTNPVLLQLGVVTGRRRRRSAVDLAFASSNPATLAEQKVGTKRRRTIKKN